MTSSARMESPSPPRLKATRTYGRQRPRASSPDFGSSSSSWQTLSSSPMPSSFLVTPPLSPVRSSKRSRVEVLVNDDSGHAGKFLDDEEETVERKVAVKKENVPPGGAKAGLGGKQSSLKGFFAPLPRPKAKLPLRPATTVSSPTSAPGPSSPSSSSNQPQPTSLSRQTLAPSTGLQQSHLTHLPLLQTCKACNMTYVRGDEDDAVHARHHGRVMRGIPWDGLGRGKSSAKGKDKADKGWREVQEVSFGSGVHVGKGRVVVCNGSWGGVKLEDILQTVDLSLSSPPLPPSILDRCRIFLFLTSSPPPPRPTASGRLRPDMLAKSKSGRSASGGNTERIVSVVVAQGIKWAMRVLKPEEADEDVKVVDSGGGVMCDPTPLDTPLGIHRLYTIPSYRSLGIAQSLLDASREHTVYGCSFDPTRGEVAFSQPTESGRAVMEKWGGGAVRVFVDDESQI